MNRTIILLCIFLKVFLITDIFLSQNQVDFRGLSTVFIDFRVSSRMSVQCMSNALLTNDFRELGVAFFDGGLKYRYNKLLGINGNYRFMLNRNLNNFYDNRHLLYFDMDIAKSFKRWTWGGTIRTQTEFYDRFINGSRKPLIYNRTKTNLKYRLNYYLHPFAELEVFLPINHPIRKKIDQFRFAIGTSYTLNDRLKLESYLQIRQQLNRSTNNTFFLIAVNCFISL